MSLPTATANPFSRATVLIVVLIGFAAFIGFLYSLGAGGTSGNGRDGNAHAVSNSLVGYKALYDLLDRTGYDVKLSRNAKGFETDGLLVLTPNGSDDSDELLDKVEGRKFIGPTLIILPKWLATTDDKLKTGWVRLQDSLWARESAAFIDRFVEAERDTQVDDPKITLAARDYRPALVALFTDDVRAPRNLVTVAGEHLHPVIRADTDGSAAVLLDNGGYYPELDLSAPDVQPAGANADIYPVVFVVEPDLFNNMGLADKARAGFAYDMIYAMADYSSGAVVFDVTLNGLGATDNLLTLAFTPPFLAATVCLILAALAAAWMAFNRFGPAFAEARAIDFGKTALVHNSAGFIRRMGREHLVTLPYVEQIRQDAAHALGLSPALDGGATEARLDAIGLYEGKPFSVLAAELRDSRKRHDIARKAQALRGWKREYIG